MRIPGYTKSWHVDLVFATVFAYLALRDHGWVFWFDIAMIGVCAWSAWNNKRRADSVEFHQVSQDELDDFKAGEEQENQEQLEAMKVELSPEEVEVLRAKLLAKIKEDQDG